MLRYWFGKIRLAGGFTVLPIALIFQIGGCVASLSAKSELTPFSVSVSGYHRSDGTYINAYNRRPSGGARHDAPHETAALIWSLISTGGAIAVGFVLFRLFLRSDWELLPSIKYQSQLPNRPKSIIVPHLTVRSRSVWMCLRCRRVIHPGDIYCYSDASRDWKYCPNCRILFVKEKAIEDEKWVAYESAIKAEKEEKKNLRLAQYHRFYGKTPVYPTNYDS